MNNTEFAKTLRELADLYDTTELPQPSWASLYGGGLLLFTYEAQEFKKAVKALTKFGVKKEYDDSSMRIRAEVGGIGITAFISRGEVCSKKVVGKKMVPETIIPSVPSRVVPEHEEEIIEWDCKKSLLEDFDVVAENKEGEI